MDLRPSRKSMASEFLKYAQLGPFLEVDVDRAAGAELLGHRLPLEAGRQHIENAADDISHPQARAAPFGALGIYRDQQIQPFPQCVGNLVKP
jgi:hypothetical protein